LDKSAREQEAFLAQEKARIMGNDVMTSKSTEQDRDGA
jgi:hypothetical protein